MSEPDTCEPDARERLLLRAALLHGRQAEDAWQEWRRSVDLDRLDTVSADLLPLLGWNLARQGIEAAEAPYFRWLHRSVWAANARRQVSVSVLLHRLEEAGIQTMLLKGMALVSADYADVGLRVMTDVDLLVPADQAIAAMRCLRADGWQPMGRATFCKAPELTVPVRHAHEFGRGTDERVDLHWHVLPETCGTETDALFWQSARHVHVSGASTRVLGPAHQLLHTCIHGARWSRPRHIRWMADAVTVLERAGHMDWPAVVAAARATGTVQPLHRAFSLLRDRLDVGVPDSTFAALQTTPISPIDRLRHRLESRRPGWAASLALHACRQWSLARRTRHGVPLLGLPGYVRRLYEIEDLAHVRRLFAQEMRRVTHAAQEAFRT